MSNVLSLMEKFLDSPLAKKFEEEEKTKVFEARKEAAAEREKLLKKLEELPSADVVTSDLKRDLARAENEAKILLERIAGRQAQNRSKRFELETQLQRVEADLIESCDGAVDKAILFFRDKHLALRHATVFRETRDQGLNLVTLRRDLETSNNVAAIEKAMSYCLNAVKKLEQMRLLPELDSGDIQALFAGLPDIGIMNSVSHMRPPEKVRPVPELWTLPSESETDWKIGKVLKKADRLLRKSH
jgi:hypothetical protein